MPTFTKLSLRPYLRATLILLLLGAFVPGTLLPPAALAETSADPDSEIVYLDNTGVIRILDLMQSGNAPLVDWSSPTGGWENIALGDVNNDGDREIISIKDASGVTTLTVWDPVVANGAFDAKTPNGIPWAKLYERTDQGNQKMVGTGKLDANLPGDHIAYVLQINASTQKLIVLKPTTATPTGREWTTHFTRDFNEEWETISIGNVDNSGADEIALVDREQGRLSVYRADGTSGSILNRTGTDRPYRVGLIAQFDGNRGKDVIAIRNGELLPSYFVLKFDSGSFSEVKSEAFNPSPRAAFAADINDDGKEEIVMLRQSTAIGNVVRMIVRGDDQSKVPVELEQFLDKDNGYESGASGDVDGDGKDEIIIMRDNNIRVYTQPDRNASFSDYGRQTNKDSIIIGDLDRNGFRIGNLLSSSISSIEETWQIGGTGNTKQFELRNATDNNIPISYRIEVEGNPSWLTVSPTFGNTPGFVTYQANAVNLAAGDYTTRLRITSDNQTVINQPFFINVKLKATPALLEPRPDSLAFSYLTSQQPVTLTRLVGIFGTDGVRYTAAVASVPAVQSAAASLTGEITNGYVAEDGRVIVQDAAGNEALLDQQDSTSVSWLAVTPAEGVVPGNLTLTAFSNNQTNSFDQAYLVIIGDSRTGRPPQNVRLVPIAMLRATTQIFIPAVFR
jgi:hypothetical protein